MSCIAVVRILAVMVAFAVVMPADAHSLSDRYGDLWGAFLHPIVSLDHALGLAAAGLLAGQQRAAARRAVAVLVAGLLGGVMLPILLGIDGDVVPHLTAVNIASLFVLGVLVALAVPTPLSVVLVLVGFFGFSHGLENGGDMAEGSRPLLVVAGVLLAGLTLAVPAAAIATVLNAGWPRIAVQVAGSWIAAIGLMMLGFELKRLFG